MDPFLLSVLLFFSLLLIFFFLRKELRYLHRKNQIRRTESRSTAPIPSRNVDPFHLNMKKVMIDSDTVGGYYIELPIYSPYENVESIYALADTGSDFLIVSSSDCKVDKCSNPFSGMTEWPCSSGKENCIIDNCDQKNIDDETSKAIICRISDSDQHFTYGDGDFEGYFYHAEMETNGSQFINFEMATIDKIISGESPNTCGLLPSSSDLIQKEKEDRSFIGTVLKHINQDQPLGYIIDMKNDVIKFGDILRVPHIPLATDVTDSGGSNISDKYFFLKVQGMKIGSSDPDYTPKYIIIDTGTSLCGFNSKFYNQIKSSPQGIQVNFQLEDGSTLDMNLTPNFYKKGYIDESHMDFLDSGDFGDAIILGQIVLNNKILSVDLGRNDGIKKMAIEN